MPTVLGKIAVMEGWHLSLACGESGMRTDSVRAGWACALMVSRTALFPSHSPIPRSECQH